MKLKQLRRKVASDQEERCHFLLASSDYAAGRLKQAARPLSRLKLFRDPRSCAGKASRSAPRGMGSFRQRRWFLVIVQMTTGIGKGDDDIDGHDDDYYDDDDDDDDDEAYEGDDCGDGQT